MTTERLFTCPVRLTKAVQDAFKRFGWAETGFLTQQPTFTVQIEKNKEPEQTATKVLLYFTHFSQPDNAGKMPVLTLLEEDHVLTAVHFMMVPKKIGQPTNWRRSVQLAFSPDGRVKNPMPPAFREWLQDLPFANERTDYVRKRIAGWEGYLAIQEQQLDIPDIKFRYQDVAVQKDFRKLTLYQVELKSEEWKQMRQMDIKLLSLGREVGKVSKASPRDRILEIEVLSYMEDVIRRTPLDRLGNEAVVSNFASLSQIRRLRSGFQQLERGQAENPLLEQILFEETPPVAPLRTIPKLTFSHPLNPFQRRAVEGAIAAEDLYVIQGPPGTGKTTVISEICLQNAKAGLRTLVASQSNLAVDNALSRLLANKDIRILRVGRTESIEEEGQRFIEENIGQYWRDVTLKTVTDAVSERAPRLEHITSELARLRPLFQETEARLEECQQAVQKKERAVAEQKVLQTELTELLTNMEQIEEQRTRLQEQVEKASKKVLDAQEVKAQLEEKQKSYPEPQIIQAEIAEKTERIQAVDQLLEIKALLQELEATQQQLEEIERELADLESKLQVMDSEIDEIRQLRSVAAIHQMLEREPAFATARVLFKVKGIEGIRGLVKTYHPAKELYTRYDKALLYFIGLLDEKKRPVRPVAEPTFTHPELERYLEQGRHWIRMKQLPLNRELADYVQGLYTRMRYLAAIDAYYEELVIRGESELGLLREELHEQALLQNQQERKQARTLEERKEHLSEVHREQMSRWDEMDGEAVRPQLEEVDATTKFTLERELVTLERLRVEIESFEATYQTASDALQDAEKESHAAQEQLTTFLTESASYDEERTRLEQEIRLLEPIINEKPEEQLEAVQKEWLSLKFELDKYEKEDKEAPVHQALQTQWQELLEQATAEDVDEIRKLNVKYANVIGTTCVASARKDFIENYPSFDVVIIDEVSKATPPELLLPMLKGKKVILVGDHHQLPPLLGDDTLEETLAQLVEEQTEFTGKQELEKLLKESLFERLYKHLPATHKTMLAIQYRMHETIMETIAPFYQYEQDALSCGLEDSESQRAHGLETSWLRKQDHVVWVDLPNQQGFLEQRAKGGSSLWNPAELEVTKKALIDLNAAVERSKQQGLFPLDAQKTVGVISFYGEQVKQLDRLIQQELRLPHLHMRTGTVDRFQGMEMEVIVLSMVRNQTEGRGDIGFANDYRRLNVALSRAKELLILIGSQEMFTKRVKRDATRAMYGHVVQLVDRLEARRTPEEVSGDGRATSKIEEPITP